MKAVAEALPSVRGRKPRRTGKVWRNLTIAVSLLSFVLLASLAAVLFLPDPGAQDLRNTLQPPSLQHPFGTDDLGRDLLSRTLHATWLDLGLALSVTAASIVLGGLIGLLAGYRGGWVERALMRLVDFVVGFPYLVFVLVVVAVLGPGILSLVVALMMFNWALYARLVRSEILTIREAAYVDAARSMALPTPRIVFRHVLPNLLRPLAVYALSDVMGVILLIASLSFLGLGVPPPTPEWGAIIADGQEQLGLAWWMSTLPGLVVLVVGYALMLAGDSLGEILGVNRDLT
ncbi:ABC transporter permease [Rhizohabitans arisaemae]|uniref:ABC transporter permease n=1 Tax=Rhizohabitans arisaemae TaxID=2720610 RepID=UPI0024B0E995|nr:ABC transporter permease [Rhizohabitans arisaemae]